MGKRHTPFDVGMATAETLAHRLPILWWGMVSPTPKSNAEITRMVVEKQLAFVEGIMAMQIELVRQAMTPWWQWSGSDAHHAAVAPAARRVKANAKRLRRAS